MRGMPGGVCSKILDHDGNHMANIHRNKENSTFVCNEEGEKIMVLDKVGHMEYIYNAGDLSTPEDCHSSCIRRGRSHFHLKECPRGEDCPAREGLPGVRHSNLRFHPFEEKTFDIWQCVEYWKSLNWDPPFIDDPAMMEIIPSCNFFCKHYSHEGEPRYCTDGAWHTDSKAYKDHNFPCEHENTNDIDVVFACDCTGSMGSYIGKAKETIHKMITEVRKVNEASEIRVGFIAYQDHCNGANLLKVQDFTTDIGRINSFILTLYAGGGGDCPEAVVDALEAAAYKVAWAGKSNKFLVHILDAPPHGREFYSGGG